MSSELMVRIQGSNVPISVSKIENGIEVGQREVLVDDYIRSLMDSLDDEELIGYLMQKNFLEAVLNYLTREVDDDIYNEIFKLFINNCSDFTNTDIEKHELFTKMLTILLEKVNVKEVNENLLEDLLKSIFLNVNSADFRDMAAYNKLFRVLLDKADIHSGSSVVIRDFLNQVLVKMKNTKNEADLKAIFDVIVEKGAKADWVEEVIRDRKPKTAFHKTPILPSGTVFYKESIGGLKTIIMEVPKHQRDVEFKNLHYKSVGHPNLLFVYQVSGKQIQNMMIFAKDSKPLTEDSTLYHYPYAHVYESGKVCWGYRNEVINNLSQLRILTRVFLDTPNNHDLARKGSVERLVKLQRKEFEDNLLEPTNLTFEKLADLI